MHPSSSLPHQKPKTNGRGRLVPAFFIRFSDWLYVPVRLARSADVLPRCRLGSGSPHPAPRCRVIAPRCQLGALSTAGNHSPACSAPCLIGCTLTYAFPLFFKHTGAAPPRVKRVCHYWRCYCTIRLTRRATPVPRCHRRKPQ